MHVLYSLLQALNHPNMRIFYYMMVGSARIVYPSWADLFDIILFAQRFQSHNRHRVHKNSASCCCSLLVNNSHICIVTHILILAIGPSRHCSFLIKWFDLWFAQCSRLIFFFCCCCLNQIKSAPNKQQI